MNDGMYLRICAIRKNNNGWEFSDCNGESLKAPDEKSIFTSSMNKRQNVKSTLLMKTPHVYGF